MKYDELLKILRECNDCICEEHCPYHEDRNNPVKCMTKIVGDAADAIEELLGVIQRQKETINASAYLPLYQKPKWIPVTESLPDAHKNVLCCGSKGGQFVGWVSNHVANGKALAFVHGGYGRLITHWMPLPEPPEEEK